jgi:hypothetical protein
MKTTFIVSAVLSLSFCFSACAFGQSGYQCGDRLSIATPGNYASAPNTRYGYDVQGRQPDRVYYIDPKQPGQKRIRVEQYFINRGGYGYPMGGYPMGGYAMPQYPAPQYPAYGYPGYGMAGYGGTGGYGYGNPYGYGGYPGIHLGIGY